MSKSVIFVNQTCSTEKYNNVVFSPEKLPSPLSVSLYVSHKSGKNSPNMSGLENKELTSKKYIDLNDLDLEQVRTLLAEVVRKCPDAEMVPRGGLEPPCPYGQRILRIGG